MAGGLVGNGGAFRRRQGRAKARPGGPGPRPARGVTTRLACGIKLKLRAKHGGRRRTVTVRITRYVF